MLALVYVLAAAAVVALGVAFLRLPKASRPWNQIPAPRIIWLRVRHHRERHDYLDMLDEACFQAYRGDDPGGRTVEVGTGRIARTVDRAQLAHLLLPSRRNVAVDRWIERRVPPATVQSWLDVAPDCPDAIFNLDQWQGADIGPDEWLTHFRDQVVWDDVEYVQHHMPPRHRHDLPAAALWARWFVHGSATAPAQVGLLTPTRSDRRGDMVQIGEYYALTDAERAPWFALAGMSPADVSDDPSASIETLRAVVALQGSGRQR